MKKLTFILIVIIALWSTWAFIGRDAVLPHIDTHVDWIENISANDTLCTKNIVGIQPYMLPSDYLSQEQFYQKLKAYFQEANNAGYFKSNTLVLLPEYLGTWLVISYEKHSVAQATTINKAMTLMVLSNPLQFIQAYTKGLDEKDAFAAALFRMKARTMAHSYSTVFTRLAIEYKVTINAGSIILPGPSVLSGTDINIDTSKPLFNSSFVFLADGTIADYIVKKSYPISSELPFISAHPIGELNTYNLSIGKTAILVCADSWYPDSYRQIDKLEADVILVNSYCAGENTMAGKWKGYDGGDEPTDVNREDIGILTEQEAWIKYALPGRLKSTGASIGVNVFLRGALWDLGTDGQPFFIKDGQLIRTGKSDKAGIWNLCF